MDFTAWNWASSFRLHEAACLIAGVMPISKRHPISEELPPQARPILINLAGAYYEWFLQKKNPERPKSIVLEGVLNEDGSLPPFPTLTDVTGEVVSRGAIHRFLTLMAERGLKSCYDFGPVGKAEPPHKIGHQTQAAATAPGMASSASNSAETKEQRQDRRLQACIDAGLPMNTKASLSRLPDGVSDVADHEGVTRQAFSADVKAALKRRESAKREGAPVHSA